MVGLIYRSYRWGSGLHYWLIRRLTPAGWLVLAMAVITGMLGADLGRSVASEVFAVLVAIGVVAVGVAFFFRARFQVQRQMPRFGTVGDTLVYDLYITNSGIKPQRGLTVIEEVADARMTRAEFRSMLRPSRRQSSWRLARANRSPRRRVILSERPVPDLPAGGRVEVRMELCPARRGLLRFERVAVARTDPFGLLRSFVRVPAAHTLLILPRRYPVPVLSLPGSLKFQHGGVAQASSVGQSDEFYALRDYRRGDPLRHIHWRSWARTGRPVVKEYVDEFYTRHALVLDTFTPTEAVDVFEEAVSVAASFACAVRTQESLLDLLFVGTQSYCFSAGRGLAHTQQMLEILASVQPTLDRPFQVLADSVRDHARLVSGVICVLAAWDEARQGLVRQLHESGLPMRVLVVVGADEPTGLDPGPLRADPATFRVVRVGEAEKALRTWQ